MKEAKFKEIVAKGSAELSKELKTLQEKLAKIHAGIAKPEQDGNLHGQLKLKRRVARIKTALKQLSNQDKN
jgi:ribosomal protein L29